MPEKKKRFRGYLTRLVSAAYTKVDVTPTPGKFRVIVSAEGVFEKVGDYSFLEDAKESADELAKLGNLCYVENESNRVIYMIGVD
jgi:hypothetical protein